MPSFIGTRLQVAFTGGSASFQPALFGGDGFALALSFPNVTLGPGRPNPVVVTAPDLDRLTRFDEIVVDGKYPGVRFQTIWQTTMQAIENAFRGLTEGDANQDALIAQIQTALALSQAALDTANQNTQATSIANSYTSPISVLTAASDGTITIAAHQRVYGDGTSVAVDGGSVSGFTSGDYVSVFYDDAARAGGAVAYQATTDAIAQTGDRHSVGQITIPTAGQPPATGGGVSPPGYNRPTLRPGENEV